MAKNRIVTNIIRFAIILAVFLAPFVYCYLLQFYAAMACGTNLKALASHFPAYRSYYDGQNPSSLHDLLDKEKWPQARLSSPSVLHCQMDKSLDMESSYVYRGDDLDATSPPFMILIYEKYPNHAIVPQDTFARKIGHFFTFNMFATRKRHVVLSNGNVIPLTEKEFKAAIKKDNEARINVGLNKKVLYFN